MAGRPLDSRRPGSCAAGQTDGNGEDEYADAYTDCLFSLMGFAPSHGDARTPCRVIPARLIE